MEALELLGSRYIKPEQVAVGPVETLRAQNAATWRVVFIHRVSTAQASGEQADLLKLLTTALVRSSEAKRLVLDFGEEQGFWNVVTESEPQCESLRDWLQAEVAGAEKGEAILSAEQAAAMGEFARLFARGVKHTPRKVAPAKAPTASMEAPAKPKSPEPDPVPFHLDAAPPLEPATPVEPAPVAEAAPPVEPAPVLEAAPFVEPAPAAEAPLPALTPEPVPEPIVPAVEEITTQPESHPQEPEIPLQAEEELPVVVPEEIPIIVISSPPLVSKAMAATQSIVEPKPPLEEPYVPPASPLPPRSFVPRPPPLAATPVVRTEPLTPEIVTELPKAVADAPKVIPIDARPHESKPDTPKTDSRAEAALQDDAPLFANAMPKAGKLSKMAVFFIVLGVVAVLLVLVIVYLSTNKS